MVLDRIDHGRDALVDKSARQKNRSDGFATFSCCLHSAPFAEPIGRFEKLSYLLGDDLATLFKDQVPVVVEDIVFAIFY